MRCHIPVSIHVLTILSLDAAGHLPDVEKFSGLVNLLSLCNLIVLGNVVDFRTYSAPNQRAEAEVDFDQHVFMERYDRTNISKQERYSMIYARGIALEFIRWVRACCVITSPEGEVLSDLPSHYLTQQMAALLKYKAEAERDGIVGAPHCTLASLEKQIANVIVCDRGLQKYWHKPLKKIDDSNLGFGSQTGYSLQWKKGSFPLRTYEQLLQDGATPLDWKYLQGELERTELDKQMVSNGNDKNDRGGDDEEDDEGDEGGDEEEYDEEDGERPRKRARR